jgi:hypothetical protein
MFPETEEALADIVTTKPGTPVFKIIEEEL